MLSHKNTPHINGSMSSLCIITADTAMIPPMVRLPVSPMKTCAGYELYHKNPIKAPMKAHKNTTISSLPGINMILR